MKVIIESDYNAISQRAAEIASVRINENPDMVLGLATGSTPELLYKILAEEYKEGRLDFSQITTFNLDEYVGLGPSHPQSYRYYMDNKFFNHINIPPNNTHVPDGLSHDICAYCKQYEEKIASSGGIDLQLLGIGRDGHLGFNEPGSSLQSRTRKVVLASETIEDNSRFFRSAEEVPEFAVSMGLKTISDAKECLLLAHGKSKAQAVKECVEGPLTAMLPASVLQLHPDTTLIIDEIAASKLERIDYYKWVESAEISK